MKLHHRGRAKWNDFFLVYYPKIGKFEVPTNIFRYQIIKLKEIFIKSNLLYSFFITI